MGPQYIQDMFVVQDTDYRSSNAISLQIPRTKLKVGDSAFGLAALQEWNALPSNIQNAQTLDLFRKKLKCNLFSWHVKNIICLKYICLAMAIIFAESTVL